MVQVRVRVRVGGLVGMVRGWGGMYYVILKMKYMDVCASGVMAAAKEKFSFVLSRLEIKVL